MTTFAPAEAGQENYAELRQMVLELRETVRALVAEKPSPACARDETPSGYKNKDFDKEEWIKLDTYRLEDHPRCETLALVIQMMRPELSPEDVRKVFRDWVRWNLRKAKDKDEEKRKSGKPVRKNRNVARRLRDLIGFAKRWKDLLRGWRRGKIAALQGVKRVAAAIASVKREAELTEAQKLTREKASASFTLFENQASDLIQAVGRDTYRARVNSAQEEFACGVKDARLVVHGRAIRCGEISP